VWGKRAGVWGKSREAGKKSARRLAGEEERKGHREREVGPKGKGGLSFAKSGMGDGNGYGARVGERGRGKTRSPVASRP